MNTVKKIIFHIDVNSAYLSWSAAHFLQKGHPTDLRKIPSIVGGNENSRHGIVLAKSIPAKKYNIKTGESLRSAFNKCPKLISVLPDYNLYMKTSSSMLKIINEYSPTIQRFSIDECFIDYTNMEKHFGEPVDAAFKIKERIKEELGFTVNIGISNNKILAKMASDFKKPDNIHTLYPDEIQYKMWHLPVSDLFMVGSKTKSKLNNLGINTIGELAGCSNNMLYSHFKSHGLLIKNYANGIDNSVVRKSNHPLIKGMGNSTTIRFDVEDKETAYKVILSLTENVCMRLRSANLSTKLICIYITTNNFHHHSHQRKIDITTDSTNYIYNIAKELFNELWNGYPIRKLGVRVSELVCNDYTQLSLFNSDVSEKYKAIDKSIDNIRSKYGNDAIYRASFLHSGISPITGGIGEENYPVMTSIL
jgi:DNA polymerase-4